MPSRWWSSAGSKMRMRCVFCLQLNTDTHLATGTAGISKHRHTPQTSVSSTAAAALAKLSLSQSQPATSHFYFFFADSAPRWPKFSHPPLSDVPLIASQTSSVVFLSIVHPPRPTCRLHRQGLSAVRTFPLLPPSSHPPTLPLSPSPAPPCLRSTLIHALQVHKWMCTNR